MLRARLRSPVEVQGHLPARPARVFEAISDPTTYPEWLVGAQRIRRVDPSFPEPSARFEHSVGPSARATLDDDTRSLVTEEPHRLVLEVYLGPMTGIVDFRLRGEGDGARMVFRERPSGRAAALTPILRPMLYARNVVSLRRLRALLARTGDR
jgi:uncharacterized protein YndB with AHSA1/START domain